MKAEFKLGRKPRKGETLRIHDYCGKVVLDAQQGHCGFLLDALYRVLYVGNDDDECETLKKAREALQLVADQCRDDYKAANKLEKVAL